MNQFWWVGLAIVMYLAMRHMYRIGVRDGDIEDMTQYSAVISGPSNIANGQECTLIGKHCNIGYGCTNVVIEECDHVLVTNSHYVIVEGVSFVHIDNMQFKHVTKNGIVELDSVEFERLRRK